MENFKIIDLKVNKQIQFMNDKMFFVGKIIKIEDKFLGVMISSAQDYVKIFNANEIANFFIVFEEEAYWCNSTVIGYRTDDYSQLLILEQPKVINRIDRRKSPRIPAILDIEYCFLPDNIGELTKVTQGYQRMKKKTFTIDISRGGIALITYEKIQKGKLLFLSFKIKENIVSVCSVVRSEANEGNRNFKTALKFVDIDVNHENIINEYINEKIKSN
ncbi:flagellar brake protein [Clostridium magnum]|uniref:PilZ domain protein n=1 Tax=Clostridium magnum DSM 2767 TaxID=1121326 RepID=A0A162S7J5_9CLOT|nr:PilZ domain-containing protein [Clostridium magnum]KZL90877.1 PilZ domain protein [Clostridium magnum DSM 2767]SHI12512.1 PilZ domain-containing protein [Clostridium magnum DSM 2767]